MGLRKKFVVLVVSMFVMTALLLSGVFYIRMKDALEEQLGYRGMSISKNLAVNSAYSVFLGEVENLKYLLRSSADEADVIYITILDQKGKVLAHTDEVEVGKNYADPLLGNPDVTEGSLVRVKNQEGEELYKISYPVFHNSGSDVPTGLQEEAEARGNQIGFVQLGLSLTELNGNLRQTFGIGMVIVLFIIAIGIGITLVFTQMMISPIEKIAHAAVKIADGDFSNKITVSSRDEIGVLADSFNKMSGTLSGIIRNIKSVSGNVAEASGKIGLSNRRLFEQTERQVAHSQRTLSSIEGMDGSAQKIVSNVEALSSVSEETSSSILEMTASSKEVANATTGLVSAMGESTSGMAEMKASVQEVSENVADLSSAAEETASAINEISSTLRTVESHSKDAASLSEQVSSDAQNLGMRSIEKTIEAMNTIQETVVKSAEVVNRLGNRSEEIGSILTVISEVTKQTNLLALNAAILAAQAGERGKGFAVVADEIKSLSDRTTSSTKEIAQLINAVQTEAKDAVEAIRMGAVNVEQGVSLSLEAGEALKKILVSSDHSTQMAKKIEQATIEQNRGVHQVTEAVGQVSHMLQQIARATQEQYNGSVQINNSSEKMNEMTHQVQLAMEEQSKGSQEITKAISNITERLQEIMKAVNAQKQETEVIVKAMVDIRRVASENNIITGEMDQAVEFLNQQAGILKQEMDRFIV